MNRSIAFPAVFQLIVPLGRTVMMMSLTGLLVGGVCEREEQRK